MATILQDYSMVVSNLIESYQKLACRMPLRLHFFHPHLDFFRDNWADIRED